MLRVLPSDEYVMERGSSVTDAITPPEPDEMTKFETVPLRYCGGHRLTVPIMALKLGSNADSALEKMLDVLRRGT